MIRFASTFCAVSDSEFNTPHSRIRLPNIRKPTSATAFGAKMPVMIVMTMGKRMRVVLTPGFLNGEREAMAIRSKSLNYNYLTISESVSSMLQVMMIGVFPLLYLGVGAVVVLRRRRKQNETV